MKKIFFNNNNHNGHQPFWNPWGFWGSLGRLLVFLLFLFLFLLFLSLFRTCENDLAQKDIPQRILNPKKPKPNPRIRFDTIRINRPLVPNPDTTDIGRTEKPGPLIIKNRLNVFLGDDADAATMERFIREFKRHYPGANYEVEYKNPATHLLRLIVPADEREQIRERLPQQIPNIDFIVFNDNVYGNQSLPNDAVFDNEQLSWYFEPIQAYEAWDITKGSPDIKVAILDSYFDLHHIDLYNERIESPYSVPRGDNVVTPAIDCDPVSFMHGSMVASMAIATMDNQEGSCGIAPQCKFIPVSLGHRFTSLTQMEGIMYAIDQGADVINISSGAMFDERVALLPVEAQIAISKELNKDEEKVWDYIFARAERNNVTIVWAAGNESLFSALDASKRNANTVRVAAVDTRLHVADFSNFGNIEEYDIHESTISAPGVNMVGAMPFNTYNVGPGTSFSAPIVTGAVALMKSLDKSLTNEEIIRILQETGKPIRGGDRVGPLLQIRDALLKVKGQFASFDDIKKDRNSLLGLWQTTDLLDVYTNEVLSGKTRIYMDIASTRSGTVIYKTTENKEYTAPLKIRWSADKIKISQPDAAVSKDVDDRFVPVEFTLSPDKNGLMKCVSTSSLGTTRPYYLKKVKEKK